MTIRNSLIHVWMTVHGALEEDPEGPELAKEHLADCEEFLALLTR